MDQPGPLPPNEDARLKALRRSKLMDSQPERMFDAITARASEICQTPMAMVSLIDKDRQWFKSKVGTDDTETHRNLAFCSHAILKNELMVVPDATKDDRFAQNPLVMGEPRIRFYAGMPLITGDGSALGTLCVIDKKPRELTADQLDQLKVLAESVRMLIEMRTSLVGEIFEKAVMVTEEGITIADGREPGFPFLFANEAFYRITGYPEADIIGGVRPMLYGEATDPAVVQKIDESLAAGQTSVTETVNYTKAGKAFWTRLTLIPILDNAGELVFVVGLQSDITAAREAEAKRLQLLGMTTTMNTVNDIVLNFMNSLQYYRMHMEETWHADAQHLKEFDTIYEETLARLTKINALTSFRSKTIAPELTVLDTE